MTAAAEPDRADNGGRLLAFILKAGILAATLATVISAILIAALSAEGFPHNGTTSPTVFEVANNAVLLVPITAVSCGSYGLLAGLAGGALFSLRRRRIRSMRKLLIEAGIAGFVLGFLFLFFDRFVGQSYANGMQLLFSAPAGALCALVCAVAFRGHFLASADEAASPASVS
jgi:hypothetical protein